MSPRTVITWAENIEIFRDPALAFRLSFLNKCDEAERRGGRVLPALLRPRAGRVVRARRPGSSDVGAAGTQLASERRTQEIRQLCAASLRALGQDPRLDLLGRHVYRGTDILPLNAPHLYPPAETASFESFRGASDGMALRVLHSDAALHRAAMPESPSARLVFEVLEQFRCESLADLPGVLANLRLRHEPGPRNTWPPGSPKPPSAC